MTPRKEIYIKIKNALATIPKLEYVGLQRGQFDNPKENYPQLMTAALIEVQTINYQNMTQGILQGNTIIEVTFYCKDGFADQYQGSQDVDDGLIEIDILDTIIDQLQGLYGDTFSALEIQSELPKQQSQMMSYTLTFNVSVVRQTQNKHTQKSLKNINLNIT